MAKVITLKPITLKRPEPQKVTVLGALKRELEKVTIVSPAVSLITGIPAKSRVPLATKAAVGALALPTPAGKTVATKAAISLGKKIVAKPLTAAKTAVLGATVAGAVTTSPTVRKVVKSAFSPTAAFSRGQELGKIVEDPSKLLPKGSQTVGERAKEVAKAAGIAGGAAAVVAGGVAAAKKYYEKRKAKKAAEQTGIIPIDQAQTQLIPYAVLPEQPFVPEKVTPETVTEAPQSTFAGQPTLTVVQIQNVFGE